MFITIFFYFIFYFLFNFPEQSRGLKVFRTAKRVSGQLLTLIVFEVHEPVSPSPVDMSVGAMTVGQKGASGVSGVGVTGVGGLGGRIEGGRGGGRGDEGGRGGGGKGGEVSVYDPFMSGQQGESVSESGQALVTVGVNKGGNDGGNEEEDDDSDYEYITESDSDEEEKNISITRNGIDIPSVPVYTAPLFRIVAYDSKSRRKLILTVPKEALREISGGHHSQYLAPDRRKELASVLCDTLLCIFPRGLPFELIIPWSGADPEDMALASVGNKTVGEKLVMNDRTGKLFRAGLRISDLDLLVTVYASPTPPEQHTGTDTGSGAGRGSGGGSGTVTTTNSTAHADGTSSLGQDNLEAPLTISFYRALTSETIDIFVTKQQQLDRLGVTVTSVPDGAPRAVAIRRLCRFFIAYLVFPVVEIVVIKPMTEELLLEFNAQKPVRNRVEDDEDSEDEEKKRIESLEASVTATFVGTCARTTRKRSVPKPESTLCVELLPSGKDYVSDYKLIKIVPVEEERPVGLPAAFIPLDIVGELMLRRVVPLRNKPYTGNADSIHPVVLTPARSTRRESTSKNKNLNSSMKMRSRENSVMKIKDIDKNIDKNNIHRNSIKDADKNADKIVKKKRVFRGKKVDYQVSIHAKAPTDSTSRDSSDNDDKNNIHENMINCAKGLVIRLYNQQSTENLVLHIASSELQRVCESNGANLLLSDMNGVKSESDQRPPLGSLAKGLQSIIKVDELQVISVSLCMLACMLVFLYVCFFFCLREYY